MYQGILYYCVGDKHAVNLAVSLATLRDHWDGPVTVLCDQVSATYAEYLARDPHAAGSEFRVQEVRWPDGPRGTSYANKTLLMGLSPYNCTLFVDADTIWNGPPKFPQTDHVWLTRFADWKSNGRKLKGRTEKWRDVAPEMVALMQGHPYPAINTGVFGWRKGQVAQEFQRAWRELCLKRIGFICDEVACQLMFLDHPHDVKTDRYNWSPMYSRIPASEALIWHFHGKKGVKRRAGRRYWMPHYERCVKENIGRLRDWTPAGYKELRKWLENPEHYGGPDD